MLVEILVTDSCPSCDRTVAVWDAACREAGAALDIINVSGPEGKRRLEAMKLGTVPAVLIDGKLVAIGLQSGQVARELITTAGTH